MAQFLFLYVEGDTPPAQMEASMKDWTAWIEKLGAKGHLAQPGAPFGDGGKVLSQGGGVKTYDPKTGTHATGYSVIEAKDLAEATALAKDCPQLNPKYGVGTIEIRPIVAM